MKNGHFSFVLLWHAKRHKKPAVWRVLITELKKDYLRVICACSLSFFLMSSASALATPLLDHLWSAFDESLGLTETELSDFADDLITAIF